MRNEKLLESWLGTRVLEALKEMVEKGFATFEFVDDRTYLRLPENGLLFQFVPSGMKRIE